MRPSRLSLVILLLVGAATVLATVDLSPSRAGSGAASGKPVDKGELKVGDEAPDFTLQETW